MKDYSFAAMMLLRVRGKFGLVSVKELNTLVAYLVANKTDGSNLTNGQIKNVMGR